MARNRAQAGEGAQWSGTRLSQNRIGVRNRSTLRPVGFCAPATIERGTPMQMLSLAFTPRFVCYTLSILFAATLLLIIVVVPSSIYVAGIPLALFEPRQAGGGLSARQDGAGQAPVRDPVRRL